MQTETPTLTPPTAETLLAQLPDLSTLSIPYSVLSLLSYDIAIQYASIPYKITESGATEVLVADPFDTTSLQAIQMGIGATIRPIAAPREQIIKLIAKYYAHANSQNQNGTDNAKTGPKRFDLSGSTSATAIVDDLLHR